MDRKLVLFDIDGTLMEGIDKTGYRNSLSFAMREVFGSEMRLDGVQIHGSTDVRIMLDVANKNGISEDVARPRIRELAERYLEHRSAAFVPSNFRALPGVTELLKELKSKGCILGITTGNLKGIGDLKLKAVNLHDYFEVYGYSDVSEVRAEVLKDAIKQAEHKFKTKFKGNEIFYFGDTPLDIDCGRRCDVRTVAVATGMYPFEELSKFNPDFIFRDFTDKESVIKILE